MRPSARSLSATYSNKQCQQSTCHPNTGIDVEGGQRGVICSLARALLELPSTVEDATHQIWEALERSEWSDPNWPWTQETVHEIVADIDAAERPALRNGTVKINLPRKARRER